MSQLKVHDVPLPEASPRTEPPSSHATPVGVEDVLAVKEIEVTAELVM